MNKELREDLEEPIRVLRQKYGLVGTREYGLFEEELIFLFGSYATEREQAYKQELMGKAKTYIVELSWKNAKSEEAIPLSVLQDEPNKEEIL